MATQNDEQVLRTFAPENNFRAWENWLKKRPRQPGLFLRENSEYVAKQMHDLVASGVPLDYETLEELRNTRNLNGEVLFWRVGDTFRQDPRVHRWLIGQKREDKVLGDHQIHNLPEPTEEERKYAFQSLKDRVEEVAKKDPSRLIGSGSEGWVVENLLKHPDSNIAGWASDAIRDAEDVLADRVVKDTLKPVGSQNDSLQLALQNISPRYDNYQEVLSHVKRGLSRHPRIFDILGRQNAGAPAREQELFDRAIGAGQTPTPQQTAKMLDNNYHLWNKLHSRPDLALEALPYVKNQESLVTRVLGMAPEKVSREHMLRFGADHTALLNTGLKDGRVNLDDLTQMMRGTPKARESALRAGVPRFLHPGRPPIFVSPLEARHLREVLPLVLEDLKTGVSDSPAALAEHKSLDADMADQLFEGARTKEGRPEHSLIGVLSNNPVLGADTISKILNDRSLDLRHRRNVVGLPNATKQHEEQALRDPLLFSAIAGKADADPDNLRELYRRYESGEGDFTHHTVAPLWINPSTPSDVIDRHIQNFHKAVNDMGPQPPQTGDRDSPELARWKVRNLQVLNQYGPAVRMILDHGNVSTETMATIDRSPMVDAILKPEHRENLKERLALENPDRYQGPNGKRVGVRVGSARYRRARDHIAATGKPQLPPKAMIAGDWSVARAPNGDISADRLDQHIATMPEMKFNVTYGRWGTKLEGKRSEHSLSDMRRHRLSEQRHSAGISKVFQLNLTDDHVRQMKDAGVFDTFKKVYEASKYSNHPVGKAGIGWVRWTGKKGSQPGIFVDEVQSDLGGFGRSLSADARKKAQADARDKQLPPDQAKVYEDEFVKRAQGEFDAQYPPDHLAKINQIVFGGHKPNEVILESFHQHLRDRGLHHAVVHIHSVDSKKKQMLDADYFEDGAVPAHFQHTYEQLPKKMGMQPAKYGELQTESNPDMKGLPVWEGPVRKMEDLVKMAYRSKPWTRENARDWTEVHRGYRPEEYVGAKDLGNGMFIHHYTGRGAKPDAPGSFQVYHLTTDGPDPVHVRNRPVAAFVGGWPQPYGFQVDTTVVHPDHQRKGFAEMMYRHLIDKYGEVHSDSEQTDGGAALWNRLSRAPDLESNIVPHGQPGRSAIAKRGRLGKSEREKTLTEVSSVAVFDPRGRLLLGRRTDSKKWTLPGGHAEPNEDPDDCARRELKEEAGIDLPLDRFTFLGTGRVNGVVVCSYAVYLKPTEMKDAPHGRDDPDEECSEWKFFGASNGLPKEVKEELHAPKNVTLALAGLGSPEGIDFGEGLSLASESNEALVVPKSDASAPKSGQVLKKSEWQPEGGWHDGSLYPRVTPGSKLGKLTVGERCDNQSSIGASLLDYSHMGLREVPVEHLVEPGTPLSKLYYSADDHARVKQLMRDISESKRIDPLIVVTEPKGPYVLEGGHRIAAMHLMGMKSVPARVVRNDEEEWPVKGEGVKKSEVDELLQHPDPLERSIALRSVGVGPHHLIRALHDPDLGVRTTAAHHPGVDAHVLLGFMAAPFFARQEQLQLLRDHPAVNQDHVRALVGFVARDPNGEPPETVRTLAQNPLLDEDSVRALWDLGDHGTRMLLVGHPACPSDLREGVVQDELRQPLGASTAALAIEALAHPLASPLRAAVLRSGRMELVSALVGAPDLEPELIDEVLGYGKVPSEPDEWADARVKVLSGRNVCKRHLDTALEDRHPAVRMAVFSSPSGDLSRAHVLRAVARGEPELVAAAFRSRVGGVA